MKKIIFTSAAVFLIINSLFSQSGWHTVYSVSDNLLESVFFTDSVTGYAAGHNLLLKTTNNGENWFQSTTQYLSFVHNIFFVDNNTGFIAEEFDGDGPPPFGWISKTTNGGYNWFAPKQGVEGAILFSLCFVNSYTGFGVGYSGVWGWNGLSGSKYKTTDGGNIWFRIGYDGDLICSYSSVFFLNENTGYITRSVLGSQFSPNVLKTTDGGISWMELLPNTWSKLLKCVYFKDVNTGFACGNGLIMTSNGGNNWYTINDGGQYYNIKFTSPSTGYCVGDTNQILKTTNGGVNWYKQISPVNNNLRDCFFINSNTGYIVGGNYQTGIILKTTTGGENFVGNGLISKRIPSGFRLFQNYPNPFNPYTRIKFALPLNHEMAAVKLVIYDNLGRIISTLVNGQLKPGNYEAEWDASQYTSGIYFYRLTAGELSETKKMILIK